MPPPNGVREIDEGCFVKGVKWGLSYEAFYEAV